MYERLVHEDDYPEIYELIQKGVDQFPLSYLSADTITALREDPAYHDKLEIVCEEEDGRIIGHAMLVEVAVDDFEEEFIGLGLVPIIIHPEIENRSELAIKLFNNLVQRAIAEGYYFIHVIGDEEIYGLFGYEQSNVFGITSSLPIPGDKILIKAIQVNGLRGISGVLKYPKPFYPES